MLSISDKCIEEHLALVVLAEVVLTLDAETVEAATQGETFQSLAVHVLEAYSLDEVEEILVWSVLLSLLYYSLGCSSSHALDGREPKSYLALTVDTEAYETLVDIRSECGYVHGLTFLHELLYLCNLAEAACH